MFAHFSRFLVALCAIWIATFVADSLLKLSEKAAEIVMPTEDLKKLAGDSAQEEEKSVPSEPKDDSPKPAEVASKEQERRVEEVPEKQAEKRVAPSHDSQEPTTTKGDHAKVAQSSPPKEYKVPMPVEATPDELSRGDVSRGEVTESDVNPAESLDAETRLAVAEANSAGQPVPPMFNLGEAGQLASFVGEGTSGSSGSGPFGNGVHPVWDVIVRGDVSARDVTLPPGFRLVAIRTRRTVTEIVPLGSTLPPAPLNIDAFVKQFPNHGSRQGIRLSSQMIQPWRERLLNYDSHLGWRIWLSLEDATYAEWLRMLRDEVRRQGRSLNDLAKVTSSIQFGRRGSRMGGAMVIEELSWKGNEP